jgi:hypothetical protein
MLPFLLNFSYLLLVLLDHQLLSIMRLISQSLNDCGNLSVTLFNRLVTQFALKLLHLLLLLSKEFIFPFFLFNLCLFFFILQFNLMSSIGFLEFLVKRPSVAYQLLLKLHSL